MDRRKFLTYVGCGCNEISMEYLYKNINKLEKNYDYNYSWRNYYNYKLKNEYKELFNLFDLSIFMKAPSFKYVFNWRYKQEVKNNSKSKYFKKMSIDEIEFFIQHFEKITKWMIKDFSDQIIGMKMYNVYKKILREETLSKKKFKLL